MTASPEWIVSRSAELPRSALLRAEAEALRGRGAPWVLLSAAPPPAPGLASAGAETLLSGERAAQVFRGKVRWGRWDEARMLLHLDSGPILTIEGRRLDPWRMTGASSIPASPAWRDYEARARLLGWSALALVPGTVVTFVLARLTTGWKASLGAVAAPWIALVVLAAVRYQWFACPRCGRAFHQTFWRHDPIASRCLHCGLAKWSDPDASQESR